MSRVPSSWICAPLVAVRVSAGSVAPGHGAVARGDGVAAAGDRAQGCYHGGGTRAENGGDVHLYR